MEAWGRGVGAVRRGRGKTASWEGEQRKGNSLVSGLEATAPTPRYPERPGAPGLGGDSCREGTAATTEPLLRTQHPPNSVSHHRAPRSL